MHGDPGDCAEPRLTLHPLEVVRHCEVGAEGVLNRDYVGATDDGHLGGGCQA